MVEQEGQAQKGRQAMKLDCDRRGDTGQQVGGQC